MKVVTHNRYAQVYSLMLALIILLTVLIPKLVAIGFVGWVFVILYGVLRKEITLKKPGFIGTLFIVFFLSYLVGVLFTDHTAVAWKYIEYKLSFLIVPLLFALRPKGGISITPVFLTYLASVLILGAASVVSVLINGNQSMGMFAYTSSNFSTLHHPSYFAVYAFFAMLIALHEYRHGQWGVGKLLSGVLIACYILFQVLCMSLAGLLFLLLFFLAAGIYITYKKKGMIGLLVSIIIIPAMAFAMLRFVPGLSSQFETSKLYLLEYLEDPHQFVKSKQGAIGGNETRLVLWTATVMEIGEHPMGVGTGNTDDHLGQRLTELGQSEMAEKNYNPHNQFLQTWLEIGLIGFIILMGIIGVALISGIRQNNWLLAFLALNLAFNCLFESMLQRQSGVVFYTFWLVVLSVYGFNKTSKTSVNNRV